MKQLVFVTGDNCNLSEEMQEKVDLFHTISPEVEIIRMETGKDENAFTALMISYQLMHHAGRKQMAK